MTHEEMSSATRKALSASLKRLCAQKPFSGITVSSIIRDCGVNRNTFYYHFEDINALLNWTLKQDILVGLKESGAADYEGAYIFITRYMEENAAFLRSIYCSAGQGMLQEFLCKSLAAGMQDWIDREEKERGLHASEDFKEFLARFLTDAVVGKLVRWIENPAAQNRQKEAACSAFLMRSVIPLMLEMSDARMIPVV